MKHREKKTEKHQQRTVSCRTILSIILGIIQIPEREKGRQKKNI